MQGVGDMRVHRLRGFEGKNPDWGVGGEGMRGSRAGRFLREEKGAKKETGKGKRKKRRECSGLSFRTLQFFWLPFLFLDSFSIFSSRTGVRFASLVFFFSSSRSGFGLSYLISRAHEIPLAYASA
jgi:hypothetical protein